MAVRSDRRFPMPFRPRKPAPPLKGIGMDSRQQDRRGRIAGRWLQRLLPLMVAVVPAAALEAAEYYTEPPLYGMRPNPNAETEMGPIGATGIEARIYKGVQVTVEGIQPNTPAQGKLGKGDILLGVNGAKLEGKNPMVVLGTALTEAEAADGRLAFDIKPAKDGAPRQVTLTIPVLGAYSKTFPLNCEKTKKVVGRAAEFYSGKDRLKGHGFLNGLACLFLLSTGDDTYVPRVKEYFSQFLKPDGGVTGIGGMTWDNGYNGIACAEYYLRTGDRAVLPILRHYCDDAKRRQVYGIGWNHWDYGHNPSYEAGGGMIHSAGNQVLLTLLLCKVCGVEVDEKTLLGALKHWYRFAGHGAIPVADQRPWHIFRSGGRDGATAAVMHVASGAKGNTTIYKQAAEYFSLSALTSWPSREYNWEVIWDGLAGPYMLEYNPDMYYQTQQRFRWCYDLYRQASGAFSFPPGHDSLNATDAGISLALALAAPRKTLCITGAPRSKHAQDFTLPEHLWGTDADRAFLSSKHNKDFTRYGNDEEIHVPYWQLPVRLTYGPQDVKGLALDMMLKNVRHARYEVRTGAAKALCMNNRLGELEGLLRDPDPRLRRAALDGINDYRAWFLGPAVGGQALKAGAYTPALIEALSAILSDPKEAWYVVDGALQALHHAPIEVVKRNIPNILPWTTHEDWWLRESAFTALMQLQEDEELFVQYLPTLIDVLIKERHYNPHARMTLQLKDAGSRWKSDSRAGKLIVAGFARAAKETEIPSDVGERRRSVEGTISVIEVALAAIRQSPGNAAFIAEALASSGRLSALDTTSLMQIVRDKDGEVEDRFIGLVPALGALAAQERQRLSDVLFNVFRPELIRRHDAAKGPVDGKLLDLIVDLTRLREPVAGWQSVGVPLPGERIWRYYAFDPLTDKEKLDPRVGRRFRDVGLPPGLGSWFSPGFDDSTWKSGRAPIGVGVFKAHGHGRMWTATPDHSFKNNSDWGNGEFLLMRSSFDVTNLDLDYYRIRILADQGYHLYLNGNKIHTYIWFSHFPKYDQIMLGANEARCLKKGTNTLAVYANVRYEKDEKQEAYHPVGQIDLVLEGLKKKELGISR
jgi:hypothetical protein